MTTAVDFNAALRGDISAKTDAFETAATASLQELLSIANDKLWNTMGSVTVPISRSREATLGSLSDLPTNHSEVVVPPFIFNPEDYLSPSLLEKYSYVSDFFTTLEPEILASLQSESAFIDQTVQDALFQQTRERDLQILNDSLAAVDRKEARRGFPLITDQLLAARSVVIKDHANRESDRNKEITALIADRAHDGRKHAMEIGIRVEDIRSKFQLEYGSLYFKTAEYLVRKYQADVQAEVARVSAEIEQLKIKSSVDLGMVSSDNAWNGTLIGNLREQMNRVIEDARADLDIQKTQAAMQMEALSKIVEYYKDTNAAYAGQMNGINITSTEFE